MNRHLLIDADIVAYRACASAEWETEWETDVWMIRCDHKEAMISFDDQIEYLVDAAHASSYSLCFSSPDNFRKALYPAYKANRASRKPVGYKHFVQNIFSRNEGLIVTKPTLEADDCIGILATTPSQGREMIIWSIDKDLMQIPGLHLIDGAVVETSSPGTDMWFYTQVLTGDSTDNYPGCPGIGPKKAADILNKELSWTSVVNAYLKAGLTEEDALLQARMARILQASDWNSKQQEPILWTPPPTA
jgi:DNA polymerase I